MSVNTDSKASVLGSSNYQLYSPQNHSDNSNNSDVKVSKTDDKSSDKAKEIKLNDTQKRGMDIIEKTLKNKNMSDEQKAEIVQAQQKAFGLSDEMLSGAAKTSEEQKNSDTTNSANDLQKVGMNALMKALEKNSNKDSINKDAQESIIKAFDLNKDMVNQVVENFANGNKDKYILAKQQLGNMMGFNIKA